MSAVDNAFVSWAHHSDLDGLLRKGQAFKAAFQAGWDHAGGNERLAAIERMQVSVSNCCGEKVGEKFCESFGCGSLNEIMKILGDSEVGE